VIEPTIRFYIATEELNCLERCSPVQLEKQSRARGRAEQFRASRAKKRQSQTVKTDTDKADTGRRLSKK
jgi:hypothetical protein